MKSAISRFFNLMHVSSSLYKIIYKRSGSSTQRAVARVGISCFEGQFKNLQLLVASLR